MERIRKDFSTLTWVMIPVAIALNIAIGAIIYNLKVPLYLDSIGTVLVGVLAGPLAGAVTGLLSNLIWGIVPIPLVQNPNYIPYMAVAAVIGALAGLFSDVGWMKTFWRVVVAGIITGLVAAMISAPITALLYGGVTGSGTDMVVAFFSNMGAGILPASFAQGVSSDPLDKTITYLVVWFVVTTLFPKRFLGLFPRAQNLREQVAMPVVAPPAPAMRAMPESPSAASVASMDMKAGATKPAPVGKGAVKKPAVKPAPAKKPAAKKPAAKKPAAKRPAPKKLAR